MYEGRTRHRRDVGRLGDIWGTEKMCETHIGNMNAIEIGGI